MRMRAQAETCFYAEPGITHTVTRIDQFGRARQSVEQAENTKIVVRGTMFIFVMQSQRILN